VKCPVCHAELELFLRESDLAALAEAESRAERQRWDKAVDHALLIEAENGPGENLGSSA
jgi:hypothetical protein